MKVVDVLSETRIGDLTIGDIKVVVDHHTIDRCIQRNVLPSDVDRVLKKLPLIKNKLSSLDSGQQFWVWDQSLDVALGFRRINADILRFTLKTVLGAKPWNSHVPIIGV